MLNISHNKLHKIIPLTEFKSGKMVFDKDYYKILNRFLLAFAVIIIIIWNAQFDNLVNSRCFKNI